MPTSASRRPRLTWNLVEDVRQVLEYPFMVNAFRAGTIVAVLAGLVGWFMVLRRQSFAGHTLAVVGFPGAAGAVLVGVSATYGLFAFAGRRRPADRTGSQRRQPRLQRGVRGHRHRPGVRPGLRLPVRQPVRRVPRRVNALLFGSFLGITTGQVDLLLVVAVIALAILAVIGRPLLFASVDPEVAMARGVPVRGLSIIFLLLLGAAAAEVSQITGTLLVFALLVVPAATAQTWTTRPVLSVTLTVLIGLSVTWLALFVAYYSPYPIGFILTSFAFAAYLIAGGRRRLRTDPTARSRAVAS